VRWITARTRHGPAVSVTLRGKEGVLARKTGSYKFEKRRRELEKQKKRKEKLERKISKGDPEDPTFEQEP